MSEDYRRAFDAGSAALDAARYDEAIRAFDLARSYQDRPGAVFAIAWAARRQYLEVERNTLYLERAVDMAKLYLEREPNGEQAKRAQAIVDELEPLIQRAQQGKPVTSVIITTEVEGALLILDDELRSRSPLTAEVDPGEHSVTVNAEGYETVEQSFQLLEGASRSIEITMQPLPATVTLRGPDGATVWIDGLEAGTLPLAKPLVVTPGRHLVTVGDEGKISVNDTVVLGRGENEDVTVELETTRQRYIAWGALGLGVVALTLGAGFTGAALSAESDAQSIEQEKADSSIPEAQADQYDELVSERDDMRVAAIVSFGAGAAALSTGLLLYVLDQPSSFPALPQASGDRDVSFSWTPPLAGAPTTVGLRGSF